MCIVEETVVESGRIRSSVLPSTILTIASAALKTRQMLSRTTMKQTRSKNAKQSFQCQPNIHLWWVFSWNSKQRYMQINFALQVVVRPRNLFPDVICSHYFQTIAGLIHAICWHIPLGKLSPTSRYNKSRFDLPFNFS